MEFKVPYFDLAKQEREATFGALVEILLKSRLKMSLETNKGFYDEDVNAYLAGVLFEYIDPQYHQAIREVLSGCDTDVFLSATREGDPYRLYWVYKVNADDRLMDLGVFRPNQADHEAILVRTKTYYGFAAAYTQRRSGRVTALSDILEKLARRAERYVSILHEARREYLHFVEALTEGELRAFHEGLQRDVVNLPLKAKQDEFLDAYSTWARTSDPQDKARLLQLLEEIRRLDPTFRGPGFLAPPPSNPMKGAVQNIYSD